MSQPKDKEAYFQHIMLQLREKRLSKEQAVTLLKDYHEQSLHEDLPVRDQATAAAESGTLLMYPDWKERMLLPNTQARNYGRQLVFLLASEEIFQEEISRALQEAQCIYLPFEQNKRAESYSLVTLRVFEEIQHLLQQAPSDNVLVQVVISQTSEQHLLQGLIGLLKTARQENSKVTGQLIAIETGETPASVVAKLRDHAHNSGAEMFRYQDGVCQVLAWSELASYTKEQHPWHDGGVYLITGGLGGLGLLFAEEIARQCKAVTIILASRSLVTAETRAYLTTLEHYGAKIDSWQLDVTLQTDVEYLVYCIQQEYGHLDGIIHGAGIIRDNFLIKKNRGEWLNVLGAKVTGLVHLDEATRTFPLDFFLFLSSGAGVQGNIGQADYATANAFMDAYATYRNRLVASKQRSGQTLSINWPLWKDGGMRLDDEARQALWQDKGSIPLTTADGMHALYQGYASHHEQVLVLAGDRERLRTSFFELVKSTQQPVEPAAAQLIDTQQLYEKTLHQLKVLFSEKTHRKFSQLDAQEALEHYGIDSIIIMRLNRDLSRIFGELSATLFYEYQTFSALTTYLVTNFPESCTRWVGITSQSQVAVKISQPDVTPAKKTVPVEREVKVKPSIHSAIQQVSRPGAREPIAIVGLAGHYPGAATLDEYWEHLKAGDDSITEIPGDRWSLDGFYHADRQEAIAQGKSYSKWGGFLQDFANFDAAFFNISPREAYNIDPQERLFLQTCWETLEDAGYPRTRLGSQYQNRVGVFAGITRVGFHLYGPAIWSAGEKMYPRTSLSSVANRVSYFMDLHGPSMSIDTMCSSSLAAIHEACEHIYLGDCEIALAGGVNLYLHPSEYVQLCQSNMLSNDEQCRSFGQHAHGFVPGEGVGCVLLKPLSRAISDGDHIYAVIRSTNLNHGGKTNGYTVPNPDAQRALIRQAIDKAGVNARTISYIEAHGTGTELGDPIEITGLTDAFSVETSDTQFCAIGSIKSNLGHLESASGIAGLTKILLQMKHRMLVPSIHSHDLNQHIRFERTPFFVQQQLTPWERPQIKIDGELNTYHRIAGLSSFGAGGTNVHVILEEYIPEPASLPVAYMDSVSRPVMMLLSAKTPERLRSYAEALLHFIRPMLTAFSELTAASNTTQQSFLSDLAYTFQVGREPMEQRLGLIVNSVSELAEKLSDFLAGDATTVGVYLNQTLYSKEMLVSLASDDVLQEALQKWYERGDYSRLMLLWASGMNIDWKHLSRGSTARIVSAPTYPFAQDRYWIRDMIAPHADGASIPMLPALANMQPELTEVVQPQTMLAEKRLAARAPLLTDERRAVTDEMVQDTIREAVIQNIATVLICDEASVEATKSFADYGLDSILGVKFIQDLNQSLQLELQVSSIFDYSSVNAMTSYIVSIYKDVIAASLQEKEAAWPLNVPGKAEDQVEISSAAAATSGIAPSIAIGEQNALRSEPIQDNDTVPIAIIGMSGRFPQSRTVEELWAHLAQGEDLIEDVTRWDLSECATETMQNGTFCRHGGFLADIDMFDPLFFNISGVEATYMDPQQRLFLEESWTALEDAGYVGSALEGEKFGVYTGSWAGDYQALLPSDAPAQALWGNMGSVIPARIAYFLNLHGPTLSIDTSCSSSLVAIHMACQDLRSHTTDMAMAGGVFVQSTPRLYLSANQAGMLSPTGHCHSFDQDADGFAPGEGVGVIVLKRLSDALAAGDHIHGVIKGSGVNQDGTTNGITAPSANSQQRLLHSVYDTFHINPEQIQLVEAHGTGTKLGDPIEFQALSRTFRDYTDQQGYCALGSVKANLGHTQYAAGIVGIIKVLLSLKHEQIPPSVHFTAANPAIQLEGSPFYVNTQLKTWKARSDAARCAVVTGLGASGTNAHIVIGEAPQVVRQPVERPAHLLVLSARSDEQLQQQVVQLLAYLEGTSLSHLSDISYTLMMGRRHFNYRFACVVRTSAELVQRIHTWLDTRQSPSVFPSERRKQDQALKSRGEQCISRCSTQVPVQHDTVYLNDLMIIAECYVQGYELDYSQLFTAGTFSRVSLPTYPFARERYWVAARISTRDHSTAKRSGPAILHPLLHRNSSTLSTHRYTSTFSGRESFLRDHQVKGKPTLPGVAYLEMACSALDQARDDVRPDHVGLSIEDIVWAQPLVVDTEAVQVDITLTRRVNGRIAYEIHSVNETSTRLHSQGEAQMVSLPQLPDLDLGAVQSACAVRLSPQSYYAAFRSLGIVHGPTLQALEEIFVGSDQVLARLSMPAGTSDTTDQFLLHPAMLDSAIQAAAGLKLTNDGLLAFGEQPSLPFALQHLDVYGACTPHMWAWVRYSDGSTANDKVEKLDIDLFDDTGAMRVRIHGYSSRVSSGERHVTTDALTASSNASGSATMLLKPVWDAVVIEQEQGVHRSSNASRILISGGTEPLLAALQKNFPDSTMLDLEASTANADLAQQIKRKGEFTQIVWVAPVQEPVSDATVGALIPAQEQGVLSLFRLIKALLSLGYDARTLSWTIITTQCQSLHDHESGDPTHAGVHGLVGSLAKEYPQWKIRLVDFPREEEWPLNELFTLPADAQSQAWCYRQGQWYRQYLLPFQPAVRMKTTYRSGGVYIVIGGAGGLGEVWSEYMVRTYQAQVIWIGRRPLDTDIRAKQDRLASMGSTPLYLSVDATDRQALQSAREEVWQRYGRIDGLVHSAIVLQDQTLVKMEESRFRSALAAKVDISVQMAQVFGADDLDFVLFFSSIQSYTRAPGQSNYAAGSTFKDAFAHWLSQQWTCAVKVMNWGYWGSVGVVAAPFYQQRMAASGLGSIEATEAMIALETLLSSSVHQLTMINMSKPDVLPGINLQMEITSFTEEIPDLAASIALENPDQTLRAQEINASLGMERRAFDMEIGRLLWAQLQAMNVFQYQHEELAIARTRAGIKDLYKRWFAESVRVLVERSYLQSDGITYTVLNTDPVDTEEALREWDQHKAHWLNDPNLKAQVILVDATVRALPAILTGKKAATEIMFPNASMEMVEGVYKNNLVADYFNTVLTVTLEHYIQERIRLDASAQIRILEVGAGTGSTSAMIFPRLRPFQEHIVEYCYTDVSRAFLLHAERTYGPQNPFLRYEILNVEKPLAEQNIQAGSYDIVVATNVLHATSDIRRSLRTIKTALKQHGVLLLNELSAQDLFSQLTFGCLKGWWLYEDPAWRIPGSPGLYPQSWQKVLEVEGFQAVAFPASTAHMLGQQIIVAESDGLVRQKRLAQPGRLVEQTYPAIEMRVHEKELHKTIQVNVAWIETLREICTAYCRNVLSETLNIPVNKLDTTTSMVHYGMDSILALRVTNVLREDIGDISSTLLFEFETIEDVVAHLIETRRDALVKLFALDIPAATEAQTGTTNVASDVTPPDPEGPGGGGKSQAPSAESLQTVAMLLQETGPALRSPLSQGQKGLWLLQQYTPEMSAYNVPFAFHIQQEFNILAFRQACQFILRRYPILRSVIHEDQGEPEHIIPELGGLSFEQENIDLLEPEEVVPYLLKKSKEPFQLEHGPLMRVQFLFRSAVSATPPDYYVLLTIHHIIFDGASAMLLITSLWEAYHKYVQGGEPECIPDQATYTDFVQWEQNMLAGVEGKKHLAYWQEKLAGELPVLAIPTDYARPSVLRFAGASYQVTLPASLSQQIRSLARSCKVTFALVFLGIYKVLLHRYSGQEDLLVGIPTLGRPQKRFEKVLGYFVNMIAIRSHIADEQTFLDFLKILHVTLAEGLQHAVYPFPALVSELDLKREPSISPVFQASYFYQTFLRDIILERNGSSDASQHLQLAMVEGVHQEGEYDLTLEIFEGKDSFDLNLKYNSDLFEVATIKRMMEHMIHLSEKIVEKPEATIVSYDYQVASEKEKIFHLWNDTAVTYPREQNVCTLFEAQAAKTPQRIAVVFGEQQLTYAELNRRANQLARSLQKRGVGVEMLVTLCVERSLEMSIAMLGILKAGGAYIPLDPMYPKDRLAFMLEDSQATLLLTQRHLVDQLPEIKAQVVYLDQDWTEMGLEDSSNLEHQVAPERLAYMIYTSGSTGQPKGVMIPDHALTNFLLAMRSLLALTPDDVWLATTSLSFDIAAFELYLPLIVGAKSVIAGRDIVVDGGQLGAEIVKQGATIMQMTPSGWRLLLESGWQNERDIHVLCGGETLSRELAQRLLAKTTRLINLYGPTETTIWSTLHAVEKVESSIPLGDPIANTQVYVLDNYLQTVPVGVPGELYIGGDGIARGYLKRASLTAERFVPHPFSTNPGERLYRTGDLVRRCADGTIEFLGRVDHQVKVRGFRIELDEIEAVLHKQDAVQDVVVVALNDTTDHKQLVAYVILTPGTSQTISNVRNALSEIMPEYMIPTIFVVVDAFPLTPNGKVDRKKLPAPDFSSQEQGREYVAPRTPVEELLADFWVKTLKVSRVGIHDNYFQLGGDSLRSSQIIARVNQLGLYFTTKQLFQYPTIATLMDHLMADETKAGQIQKLSTLLLRLQSKKEAACS